MGNTSGARTFDLASAVGDHYGIASMPGATGDEHDRLVGSLLAGSIHRYPPVISSVRIAEDPEHWIMPSLNFAVLHDGQKFRMWYDLRDTRLWLKPNVPPGACMPATAYAESDDGIHWDMPDLGLHPYYPGIDNIVHTRQDSYSMCVALVDDGPDCSDPALRFKLMVDSIQPGSKPGKWGDPDQWDIGTMGQYAAFSSDGIHWREHENNPVMGSPEVEDIIDAYYDADLKMYVMAHKVYKKVDGENRRHVGISLSKDWVHWEHKGIVIGPLEGDDQFYGMSITKIDGVYVGFLRIYQSKIGEDDGIGWTEVATSTDLLNWRRYRHPFIPRGPLGSFDHAILWMHAPVAVGSKLYYYYGGYPISHKHAGNRGIGLLVVER